MKRIALFVILLLQLNNVNGQTPDPIATGLTDPAGLLRIGTDLYVSETGSNSRIIKVNLTEPMPATPTVVVTGVNTPMGMAQKGNYIYFCQFGNGFISRFDWTLENPVVENVVISGLTNPTTIAINGDDLYVAESGPFAERISKVDLTEPLPISQSLFVGGLSTPWGLAIYGDMLLVSESGTPNIVGFDMTVVNPPRIAISTAGMNQPKGLSLDGNTLYIADDDANNISKIELDQTFPIVPEVVTAVMHPQDVLVSNLDLFISEMGTDQVIRRLNTNALETTIASHPGNKYYTGFYNPLSNTLSHRTPGWNNPISWIPEGVPTEQSDVVALPVYGVDFTRNTTIRSITCSSDAFINIHASFKVLEPSVFNAPCYINWVSGNISGNTTITNHGQMNFTTSNMLLHDSITLVNYGGIRFESVGDLYMNKATIENKPSGEIKLDFPGTNIYQSPGVPRSSLIINEGIIRKTSTGTATISVVTENINGGTIQTEIGNLTMAGNATFDNGIINVASGTEVNWNYLADVTLTGLFTGTLDGTLSFATGDIIVPSAAIIDFAGNNPIGLYGTTITGGGVLSLKDDVSILESGFTVVSLRAGTIINNEGVFSLASTTNSFGIYESTFNNLSSGVIDIQSRDILRFQSTTEKLNNYGLIKRSTTTGTSSISVNLHNIGGTIQVERGRLNLNNPEILLEGGIYDIDSVDNVLNFRNDLTCLGDMTGTVNGSLLISNYNTKVDSATIAIFDFGGTGSIDCHGCNMSGKGTLINKSDIKTSGAFMNLRGVQFYNEGRLSTTTDHGISLHSGDFYNEQTGIVELKSNAYITRPHNSVSIFYNSGLVKKSVSEGSAYITAPLYNFDGRLQVERGNLVIQNHSALLIDGQYDVDSINNSLRFDHTVTCQGQLTGQLNGPLVWDGNVYVDSASIATFNFDGLGNIDWISGSLRGGGTLVNKSTINLMNNNELIQGTLLNNEGQFNLVTAQHRLFFNNGIINNMPTGVIDFQAVGTNFNKNSSQPSVINNMGLIKKSASTGFSYIYVPAHNSGVIEIDSGTMRFTDTLYNYTNSIVKGIATIDLPDAAHYFHEGRYSPGVSPGRLGVIGDFESTGSSVLDIELDGLVQESEYDLIAVLGAADVNGSINLSLGFDPTIGDTFTILTTTGALTSSLPATIQATSPINDVYTFDVQIHPNSIVLEVVEDCQATRVFTDESVSGNYRAGLNIIATNISVSSATEFSAPSVILSANFTVSDGQVFEITQVGCD